MNHLRRDEDAGFARDKNNPSPVALEHPFKIVPRHAYARHDVDVKIYLPSIVADLVKRLGPVNADIVDQHVDHRVRGSDGITAGSRAEISGDPDGVGGSDAFFEAGERIVYGSVGASVHDNLGAHLDEPHRGLEPDAAGGPRDQRRLAGEIKVHQLHLASGKP